jgi:hypothetical protein
MIKRIYEWLRERWWAQQRKTDMAILWPVCKERTHTLDEARAVFALHAYGDPAWAEHYGDRLEDVISALR